VDLIPQPDQVAAAAENVAMRLLEGGLADLRPMPRTLLAETDLYRIHRIERSGPAPERGDPVLLVAPLAAPASCYDLRRGCSLVEHLVETGRPAYLVEFAEVSFADRDLSLTPYVEEAVPAAVRAVSADAGDRPVHLVGWSVGGAFALLAAAADGSLPVGSTATLGTPFDVAQVPMVAPARPLVDLSETLAPLARLYQAAGGTPQPWLGRAIELPAFQQLVTRPLALAQHLDDADYLAQIEAVERLAEDTSAYRGRNYGQLYHRLLAGDDLAAGRLRLGSRTVSVGDVTTPVLVVAGSTDQIAPADAVKAVVPLLTGAREGRFEIVPGGHLGLLTGRTARTSTWPALDGWFDEWDSPPAARRKPARKSAQTTAATAPAKKTAARKSGAKITVAKKATKSATKKSTGRSATH
jgi:polyhydroxyalkanoate synthase